MGWSSASGAGCAASRKAAGGLGVGLEVGGESGMEGGGGRSKERGTRAGFSTSISGWMGGIEGLGGGRMGPMLRHPISTKQVCIDVLRTRDCELW